MTSCTFKNSDLKNRSDKQGEHKLTRKYEKVASMKIRLLRANKEVHNFGQGVNKLSTSL